MTITLSHLAFHLPLLHAARHPSSTINGVLLGRASPSPSSSSSSSSNPSPVQVVEAIPLLHQYTSLSPMMEIGLQMTSDYAAEKGLLVVGYYHANENGQGLGRVGEKIVQTLKKNYEDAFALEIVNKQITSDQPYKTSASLILPPTKLPALIKAGAHEKLGDFDDHLEDAFIDWLDNKSVTTAIQNA